MVIKYLKLIIFMTVKPIENIAQLPFVVANHPPAYAGLEFLSAIQLLNSHEPMVGIVDNVDNKNLKLFVIDLCEQESVNVSFLLESASDWFANYRHAMPISFYLSRLQEFADLTPLYKSVPLRNIIRIIGPVGIFSMSRVERTRKKKHRVPDAGVVINHVPLTTGVESI